MGLASKLSDHVRSVQSRDDWAPGYGGQDRQVRKFYEVCSCGWENRIEGSLQDVRSVNWLQHQMDVLTANSCDDCQLEQPCSQHCPKADRHQRLGGQFCTGCGRRYPQ